MSTTPGKLSAKKLTRAAFGASAGAVAMLTLLPPTGWLVRQQLGGNISGADSAAATEQYLQTVTEPELSPQLQNAAQNHPDDLGMQIAAAMQRARESKDTPQSLQVVTDLWGLRDRFGDDPVYCANYLRFACWAAPNIGRDWERDFISGTRAKADAEEAKRRDEKAVRKIRWRDDPEFAERALQVAKRGAQVDPDNSFFPFIEAAIYLAQNRDKEAYAALHHAAACSRYRDYVAAEAYGRIALQEAAEGTQGMLSRTAFASTILFPHFSTLRAAAQTATAGAIALEETGKAERGFQIRYDVARIGALMRYDGTSGITNLVGIAITGIAANKPAGQDIAKPTTSDSKVVTEQREALYRGYLTRTGHRDEAVWFVKERQQGSAVRDLMSKFADSSLWSLKPVATLIAWWCVGIALLTNALWMLVGGALAARGRHVQRQEVAPLSHPVRLALKAVAGAGTAAAVGYLPIATNDRDPVVQTAVLVLIGTVVIAAPLLRLRRNPLEKPQEMSRDTWQQAWHQSRRAYLRTVGASLLLLAGLMTVTAHVYGQVQKVSQLFNLFTSGTSSTEPGDTSHVPVQLLIFLVIAATSVGAALLTALVAALGSRRKAIPVSAGLAAGFRRTALPITTLLLVTYSSVALLTITQERRLWHAMDKAITHEGRYGADLLHQPWPERVAETSASR